MRGARRRLAPRLARVARLVAGPVVLALSLLAATNARANPAYPPVPTLYVDWYDEEGVARCDEPAEIGVHLEFAGSFQFMSPYYVVVRDGDELLGEFYDRQPRFWHRLTPGRHELIAEVRGSGATEPNETTSLIVDVPETCAGATPPDTVIVRGPADGETAEYAVWFEVSDPSESSLGYECRLDGIIWEPCPVPDPIEPDILVFAPFENEVSELQAGFTYDLEVRAVTSSGLVDPTPARWRWTVGHAPGPIWVAIVDDVPELSGEPPETIRANTLGRTAQLEVSWDGGATWTQCVRRECLVPAQPEGEVEVLLRAWTRENGLENPARAVYWTADRRGPETEVVVGPPPAVGVAGFSITLRDPTGLATGFVSGSSTFFAPSSSVSGHWEGDLFITNPLPLGTRVVAARTAVGNVDPTPEELEYYRFGGDPVLVRGPRGSQNGPYDLDFWVTNPLAALHPEDPVATWTCRLNNSVPFDCTSGPPSASTHGRIPAPTGGLPPGLYTLQVEMLSTLGVRSALWPVAMWTVTAYEGPHTTILSGPEEATVANAATLTFYDASGVSEGFECRLHADDEWAPCGTAAGEHFVHTFVDLEEGAYELAVRGVAGDASDPTPALWSLVVDRTVPTLTATRVPLPIDGDPTPSFVWDVSADVVAITYEIDGGAPQSATRQRFEPLRFYASPPVEPGPHQLRARALDGAGNASEWQAFSWVFDAEQPAVELLSVPPEVSPEAGVRLTFRSSAPDLVGFRCSGVVAGGPAPCGVETATPGVFEAVFPSVPEGIRTAEVSATDATGVYGAPVQYTFRVDRTPPVVTFTETPAPLSTDLDARFAVTTSADVVALRCSEDGGAQLDCSVPSNGALGGHEWSVPLETGEHTLTVVALDAAGWESTPAVWTWRVAPSPPETALVSGPGMDDTATYPTFEVRDPSAVASHFECSEEGGAWSRCATAVAEPGAATLTWYGPPRLGVSRTLRVRGVDQLGRADESPAEWTWSTSPRDLPALETIEAPLPLSVQPTPRFRWRDVTATAVAFECSLDDGEWLVCGEVDEGDVFVHTEAVADGDHTLRVRGVTGDGDRGDELVLSWQTDTVPPETAIVRSPTTAERAGTVLPFRVADASATMVRVECRVSASDPFETCAEVEEGRDLVDFTLERVLEGTSTFAFRTVDAAGNTDPTPASLSLSVDGVPMELEWTEVPTGPVSTPTLTVRFRVLRGDAGPGPHSFQCAYGEGGWFNCSATLIDGIWTSTRTASAVVASGPTTLRFRGWDGYGYGEPIEASLVWDTAPPETAIAAAPATTNLGGPPPVFVLEARNPVTGALESGVTFECSEGDTAWIDCSAPDRRGSYAWSFSPAIPVTGDRTLSVRAVDALGNRDTTPATVTWEVLGAIPDTRILSGPSDGHEGDATITFDSPGGTAGSVKCLLGFVSRPCGDPDPGTGIYTVALSDLTPGARYRFEATSRNPQGGYDPTPATISWRQGPYDADAEIVSGPGDDAPTTTRRFLFFDPSFGAARFECSQDGGDWVACGVPEGRAWFAYDWGGGLAGDSEHVFEVRGVTAAGVADSTPARWVWTTGTNPDPAPETSVIDGPGSGSGARNPAFVFTSPDGDVVGYECSEDAGASWVSCGGVGTGPFTYEWRGPLEHGEAATFWVRAVDAAGQPDESPATWTWTSDFDADDDEVLDDVDNCLGVSNGDQDDLDADGLGDACDPDLDGDGLENELEVATLPDDPDTDADGLCDGFVEQPIERTDEEGAPFVVCDDGEDVDLDGERDGDETDPLDADSDRDCVWDGDEVLGETPSDPLDPFDPGPFEDADEDGLNDACDDEIVLPEPDPEPFVEDVEPAPDMGGDAEPVPDMGEDVSPDATADVPPDVGRDADTSDAEGRDALGDPADDPDLRTAEDPDQGTAEDPDQGSADDPDQGSADDPDLRNADDPDLRSADDPDARNVAVSDQRGDPRPDPQVDSTHDSVPSDAALPDAALPDGGDTGLGGTERGLSSSDPDPSGCQCNVATPAPMPRGIELLALGLAALGLRSRRRRRSPGDAGPLRGAP